jgi:hypothetical protein
MMQVEVNLPDTIAAYYGATPDEIARLLREMAVVECVRHDYITPKEAGDVLGLARVDMYRLLAAHKMPLYTLEDLREDRETSHRLGL